jgi:glycosyltransferase involved in cell wall biosynthesis
LLDGLPKPGLNKWFQPPNAPYRLGPERASCPELSAILAAELNEPMRLLFVVDARSPIATNWIRYFIGKGDEVHVVSSHACPPQAVPGAHLHQLPIAFGRIRRSTADGGGSHGGSGVVVGALRRLDRATRGLLRSWLTPIDLLPHVPRLRALCDEIAPDLVHAMRIPYEGIMASMAVRHRPLLISCWGNDFTLFTTAASDRFLTRRAMRRTDALHCDCEKDVRLAYQWGFRSHKPSIVLPGAGGVDKSLFHPGKPHLNGWRLNLPENARVIVNPRGMRAYVRNDSFFQAIPLVLREAPATFFICPGMQGDASVEKIVRELSIASHVRLLPTLNREELADLFRLAEISVSPSTHDGTPNTLLEAMASGCFPVAGDIESVREWIDHGSNGLLCDPTSAESIAVALIKAIHDSNLLQLAARENIRLVSERADYAQVMCRAARFYQEMIARFSSDDLGIAPAFEAPH